MEPIVIRNDRKRLIKILLILLIPLGVGILFLFAPEHPNPARRAGDMDKLVLPLLMLIPCFFGFFLLKAIIVNPPVLIFDEKHLTYNNGIDVSMVPWEDITEWHVELGANYNTGDNVLSSFVGDMLIFTTTTTKAMVGIERLTMGPDEIYELMEQYKS